MEDVLVLITPGLATKRKARCMSAAVSCSRALARQLEALLPLSMSPLSAELLHVVAKGAVLQREPCIGPEARPWEQGRAAHSLATRPGKSAPG